MYCISDKQIDYILNDIRARGVELEDLQYNLLDHICCIIEHNLEETGDFESFYQSTIKTFYRKELWEIEEETISLIIFKNYYTMKKTMLYSGVISALMVTVGIIFKFLHWPGASALLVLGITASSLLFMPLMFILKIREKQNTKDKVIIALGSVSAIALSMGILFKIMHWPGANLLGLGSILILLCLFLPIYFVTGIRNPDTKVNTIVSSALIVIGCGLFMALVRAPKGSYMLKVRDTQSYVISQEILDNERWLCSNNRKDSMNSLNPEVMQIDGLCEELKQVVLEMETGVKKLDRNFEGKNLLIEEGSFGYNPFEAEKASTSFNTLTELLKKYNDKLGDRANRYITVPLQNNFLEYLSKGQNGMVTGLTLLGQLTQIQMIVLQNQRKNRP